VSVAHPSLVRHVRGFDYRPWVLGGLAVAGAIALFFLLGLLGVYHLSIIFAYLPDGISPATTSLELTTLSFAIGFLLATPIALLRAYAPTHLRRAKPLSVTTGLWGVPYGVASGFVAAIRGTPFLVQVILVYDAFIFAYPRLTILGETTPFWAGLVALTINSTAYQAEALRGGFQSVDAGQIDAGRALGLSRFQIFRKIVLPQSLRLVTLPLTNEWISTFKTSTLLSYITVVELYYWARTDIADHLARPIEAFVMLAIFYLVINVTVSRASTAMERRFRIPGLGSMLPDIGVRTEALRK
jgi:His/Glu/Gln/Arg/opine family amino acid ABC transporter permease subunit